MEGYASDDICLVALVVGVFVLSRWACGSLATEVLKLVDSLGHRHAVYLLGGMTVVERQTHMEQLKALGALGDMPESSQISLFGM